MRMIRRHHAYRDDVVAPCAERQGLLPAGIEEIGDDEHDRVAAHDARRELERRGEVGARLAAGKGEAVPHDAQRVAEPLGRRNVLVDVAA